MIKVYTSKDEFVNNALSMYWQQSFELNTVSLPYKPAYYKNCFHVQNKLGRRAWRSFSADPIKHTRLPLSLPLS